MWTPFFCVPMTSTLLCNHLLFRHTGFLLEKNTSTKLHLHVEHEWQIFHILTSENIDYGIFRFSTVVCVRLVCLLNNIKANLHSGLKT